VTEAWSTEGSVRRRATALCWGKSVQVFGLPYGPIPLARVAPPRQHRPRRTTLETTPATAKTPKNTACFAPKKSLRGRTTRRPRARKISAGSASAEGFEYSATPVSRLPSFPNLPLREARPGIDGGDFPGPESSLATARRGRPVVPKRRRNGPRRPFGRGSRRPNDPRREQVETALTTCLRALPSTIARPRRLWGKHGSTARIARWIQTGTQRRGLLSFRPRLALVEKGWDKDMTEASGSLGQESNVSRLGGPAR